MISIIIPIYNGGKYIDSCINMILNQTYQNFEVIVINDGSTDDSYSILQKYQKLDKRIQLFNFENHGVSWSRNFGLSQVKGEWFLFLDCDDFIPINYLEELIKCIENNTSDCVFCKLNVIDEDLNLIKTQSVPQGFYNNEEIIYLLLEFKNISTGPCAKLINSSLISKDLTFPCLKIYEDLVFNLNLLKCAQKIYFTNQTAYGYIHRENIGAMQSYSKKLTNDVIFAMRHALETIRYSKHKDYLFYRIICQVMMYATNCSYEANKVFIKETQKFLRENLINLIVNKTINKNEKLLFIIYSISFKFYDNIRRWIK